MSGITQDKRREYGLIFTGIENTEQCSIIFDWNKERCKYIVNRKGGMNKKLCNTHYQQFKINGQILQNIHPKYYINLTRELNDKLLEISISDKIGNHYTSIFIDKIEDLVMSNPKVLKAAQEERIEYKKMMELVKTQFDTKYEFRDYLKLHRIDEEGNEY